MVDGAGDGVAILYYCLSLDSFSMTDQPRKKGERMIGTARSQEPWIASETATLCAGGGGEIDMCKIVVGTFVGWCGKVSHEAAHMTLAQHRTKIRVEYGAQNVCIFTRAVTVARPLSAYGVRVPGLLFTDLQKGFLTASSDCVGNDWTCCKRFAIP